MAYGDKTKATSVEAWLEAHSPGYHYEWVLLLLGATFIVMAAGPPDAWTRVLTVFLQGLTLMAALLASRVSRRLFRLAAVVTLVSLVAALVSVVDQRVEANRPACSSCSASCWWRPCRGSSPGRSGSARWSTCETVLGAICIYVLLGMMFAFVYAAINGLGNDDFFVQTNHATTPDFLYFSYITQTTVGYGDFTAAGDLGRALAVVEALTGQLYLVTIIAVLVSRLSGAQRRDPPHRSMRRPRPARPRRDRQDGVLSAAASGSAATASRSRWSR